MPQVETRLIASLIDKISGPARAASASLKGLAGAANTQIGGAFSKLNRELGFTNRALDNMRGRMVDAIAQGYALKVALEAPIKSAIEFETTMTDIAQKTGKSRDEMRDFGKFVRELAPSTNKTALELAKAQDVLAGMGLQFDVAQKALPTLGKAATAFRADLGDLAKASMAVIDNLKVPVSGLEDALDRMAAAGKAGAFELKDMAQHMPAIAAIAQSKGMSGQKAVLQIATALQIVRKGAGDASEAATNLRNVFQKMTSDEVVGKFAKKAGVDLKSEMAKEASKGKTPLEAIVEVTKRALASKKGLSIGDLFTDMQMQLGMASLVQNADLLAKMMAEVEGSFKGATSRDYAERLNDLGSKVGGLTAAWETLKITIGNTLGPTLVPLLANMTQLAGSVAAVAERHSELAKNVTIAAAGLIALKVAATGLGWAYLSLKSAALTALVAFTPWGAALAAAAAGVALLYANWEKVKAAMPNTVAIVSEVVEKIKGLFTGSEWVTIGQQFIESLWEGMKRALGGMLRGIDSVVGTIRGYFGGAAATGGAGGGSGGSPGAPAAGGPADAGGMQPAFKGRLVSMLNDAKANGVPLFVKSGYRSQAHQNALFARSDRTGHWVARHSMHTRGLAADLGGNLGWAHANASKYGLNFPMSWERWHIEPIGARRRAKGGPVSAGSDYVVGERGWEIFRPRQSGDIINQKQLSSGGAVTMTNNFHISGSNGREIADQIERVMRDRVRSLFRGSHSDVGFATS